MCWDFKILFIFIFEAVFVISLLNAVKTDRKEDRRKREVKEQERRVRLIALLPISVLFLCFFHYLRIWTAN